MEKQKVVAFDLEVTTGWSRGEDWSLLLPLGISCAATRRSGDEETRVWSGQPNFEGDTYPPKMDVEGCETLAEYLIRAYHEGYKPVTWNGAGFDFRVLHAELETPKLQQDLIRVMKDHYDLGFQLFAARGFLKKLEVIAEGMGLPGKTEGVQGELAPLLWSMGLESQKKVLEYVANDVDMTYYLYQAVLMSGSMAWTARSGKKTYYNFPMPLTVEESLALDEPDTSWMDDPWDRRKFVEWAGLCG